MVVGPLVDILIGVGIVVACLVGKCEFSLGAPVSVLLVDGSLLVGSLVVSVVVGVVSLSGYSLVYDVVRSCVVTSLVVYTLVVSVIVGVVSLGCRSVVYTLVG